MSRPVRRANPPRIPYGSGKTAMLQAGRVQQVGEGAEFPGGFVHRIRSLVEHLLALSEADVLLQSHEMEADRYDVLGRRVVQLLGDPLPLLVLEVQEAPGELVQGRRGGTPLRHVGEEHAQPFRRGADLEIEPAAGPQAGHHLAPDAAALLHTFPDDEAALGIRLHRSQRHAPSTPPVGSCRVHRRLVEIGDAIGAVQREVAVANAGQNGPEPLVRILDLLRGSLRAAPQAGPPPFVQRVPRRGQVTHGSTPGRGITG